MIAKKKDGEVDESEQESAPIQAQVEAAAPDTQSKVGDGVKADVATKPDVAAKAPEPRKPDAAPKADAKPPEAKPQAKPKPKAEAELEAPAKPTAPKSLAEVMKFDLRVKRR
jgi:hypothetical protein